MPTPKNPLTKAAAAIALAGGLAVPIGWAMAPASAEAPTAQSDDTTTDTTTDAATDTTAPPLAGDRAARRAERRAERQRLVAEKLGVTPEELKAARIAVLSDKLAENVASGRITQERADEILQAAEDGTLPALRQRLRAERGR